MVRKAIDCSPPKSVGRPNYRTISRKFHESEVMRAHQKRIVDSLARVDGARKQVDRYSPPIPPMVQRRPASAQFEYAAYPFGYRHQKNLVHLDEAEPARRKPPPDPEKEQDLNLLLGADPTPVAKLRPPPRPLKVKEKLLLVDKQRKILDEEAGGFPRREGLTNRERRILWGTSLAPSKAMDIDLQDMVESASRPTTASSQVPQSELEPQGINVDNSFNGFRDEFLLEVLKKRREGCTESVILRIADQMWSRIATTGILKKRFKMQKEFLVGLSELLEECGIDNQAANDFYNARLEVVEEAEIRGAMPSVSKNLGTSRATALQQAKSNISVTSTQAYASAEDYRTPFSV